MRLELRDAGANREAIGAWVELEAGGVLQRRQVMPTRSYLSQVELPLTFGLGEAERVDGVRVMWPDGTVQAVEDGPVDRLTRVTRKAG